MNPGSEKNKNEHDILNYLKKKEEEGNISNWSKILKLDI
jgi:hypothetical protein